MSKKANEVKKEKKSKEKFGFRFKRWFFGIGKEFSRITWPTKGKIFKDFCIIIVIVAIMTLVFFGIDAIYFAIV